MSHLCLTRQRGIHPPRAGNLRRLLHAGDDGRLDDECVAHRTGRRESPRRVEFHGPADRVAQRSGHIVLQHQRRKQWIRVTALDRSRAGLRGDRRDTRHEMEERGP